MPEPDPPAARTPLDALLDRHAGGLRVYAASRGHRDPDDAVQEAFCRLAVHLRTGPPPADAAGWLFRTVRNLAVDRHRRAVRRRRRERAAASPDWFTPDPAAAVDAAAAEAALGELCEQRREAVVLHLWGGLSFQQIGELTATSASTAHRRYAAGIRELQIKLGATCPTH